MYIQQVLSEVRHPRYKSAFDSVHSTLLKKDFTIAMEDENNLPFWMLLISFSHRVDIICAELQQPLVELPCCPVEPVHA